MEQKNDIHIIYLKDLLFSVLYRWKALVAAVLIAAAAFGLFKGGSDFVKVSTAGEDTATADALLFEQYEAQKQSLEKKISTMQVSIKNQKDYLNNSLLMALNPYGYYQVNLQIFIDTDWQIMPGMSYQNPDRTDAIVNAYQNILSGNEALSGIANAIDVDPVYLQEVMEILPGEDGTLTVTIICAEQTMAQNMLEVLIAQTNAATTQISSSVAQHKLHIVEQSVSQQQDLTLVVTQREETDRMTNLLTELNTAELSLESLKKPVMTADISIVKNVVKFAVVGAVLGGILCVVIFMIIALVDTRVFSARALRSRTGIKVLVNVCSCASKGIDLWLKKKEGRCLADETVQAPLAAALLSRYPDLSNLLIIGDTEAADRQAFVSALKQAMPAVQIADEGSLLSQVTALNALASCDMVLLLAACGKSSYDAIAQELEVAADHNKAIAGCVLLNG